jgi:porphobilinogen synthase
MYPEERLRRTRMHDWSRRLVRENYLSSSDFILPIFICDGANKKQEINNLPNIFRHSVDMLNIEVERAINNNIPAVILFPETPQIKKDENGTEALNENNLICKAIKEIKKNFKNKIGIITDVALDPYTTHGHDGVIKNGYVDNDQTIEILKKQSLLQAQVGSDIIAPSDMMDGRIGIIRKFLEVNKFTNTQILSYSAKYASNFYGPFRNAVGSVKNLVGDKKNYQMDFSNSTESLREIKLDIEEGADMIMIKPALLYLDIISQAKKEFNIPIISYNVSGEYSMIQNAIKNSILPKESIYECLVALKRAGSNAIVTYFANDFIENFLKS